MRKQKKKHSRFHWRSLASLFLQLLSQHSNVCNIGGRKTRNSRCRDWKEISSCPPCLSNWHSRAKSESNFICLLSGPHVSWPMTYHLVAVIPLNNDAAIWRFLNPTVHDWPAAAMGLCLGRKKIKGTEGKAQVFFLFYFSKTFKNEATENWNTWVKSFLIPRKENIFSSLNQTFINYSHQFRHYLRNDNH